MDDILITSQDKSEISKFKKFLSKRFEVKDFGPIKYYLGIEFSRDKNGIRLYQGGYIGDILRRFVMINANAVA